MYLYGASGHGKVIIEILETAEIAVNGIFDDDLKKKDLLGYPVLGPFSQEIVKNDLIILSIGDNVTRKKIAGIINASFGTAIHPAAFVSRRTLIDGGTVVMAGTVINASCRIGAHAILNTSSIVEHDCQVGDFVHVSPHATVCGGVSVGEGAWIGAGAVIKQGISIGKWATIGAGAVVIRDVPDQATVVGNPGRIIRRP